MSNQFSRKYFGVFAEIKSHPLIVFGFSLFWLWVWLVVQSSFLNSSILSFFGYGIATWTVPLAAYGIAFLLLGVLYGVKRIAPRSTPYKIAVGAITTFGAASCALFSSFPTTNNGVTNTLLVIGGLLAGAGTACIHVEWGRLLSKLGSRKTIIHTSFGTMGAMLLILLCSLLPISVQWGILVVLPISCMLIVCGQQRHLVDAGESKREKEVRLYIPWRLFATSFIQGTAFGMLQTILLIVDKTQETTIISVIGSVIGAILVLVVVFAFKLDFNYLIYYVGFVILAASFAIMATAGSYFIGGWVLNAIGYRFIDILMWGLCAYFIKHYGLPTNWVFPVATCALVLGEVFGALLGQLIKTFSSTQSGGLETLSVVMLFIILLGSLFLSNTHNLEKGWGIIRPFESEGLKETRDAACMLVADGFDLTARELEIFIRLAEGQKRSGIAEELHLAPETIKTHVRNIYRKMQLHSQEELIQLVEDHKSER